MFVARSTDPEAVAAVRIQRRLFAVIVIHVTLIVVGVLASFGWWPVSYLGPGQVALATLGKLGLLLLPLFPLTLIPYVLRVRPDVVKLIRRRGTILQIGRITYYRRRRIMTRDADQKFTSDEFFDFLRRDRRSPRT